MNSRFILVFVLMLPFGLLAQQANQEIKHLNEVLNNNDSLVSFSISFPQHQSKSYSLNYLKKLAVSNQLTMPSNLKNQEQYVEGDVVSPDSPGEREEFELFMAQVHSKGPFTLHIGNEIFHVEANLDNGYVFSIDYINPKNKNILRFLYDGEAHQLVQFIFQLERYDEKSKKENVHLYFHSLTQSGAKDRNAISLNKVDVETLANLIYVITEQLIFKYKSFETQYAFANWKNETVILKVDSFLQTFNQSRAKDNYGNLYSAYFTGEKEVKIYTTTIISPAKEKSVRFEFYGMPFRGTQFNQNKIQDGLRKIILDELSYGIGSYAGFPSGAELRSLFIISRGKIKELKN